MANSRSNRVNITWSSYGVQKDEVRKPKTKFYFEYESKDKLECIWIENSNLEVRWFTMLMYRTNLGMATCIHTGTNWRWKIGQCDASNKPMRPYKAKSGCVF